MIMAAAWFAYRPMTDDGLDCEIKIGQTSLWAPPSG
jgi:hypothetical protein